MLRRRRLHDPLAGPPKAWGRCVTITRYWAGITSSRSDVSSQSAIVASRCVMHFDDRTDKTRTSERITR
jgi:hypothetical protein